MSTHLLLSSHAHTQRHCRPVPLPCSLSFWLADPSSLPSHTHLTSLQSQIMFFVFFYFILNQVSDNKYPVTRGQGLPLAWRDARWLTKTFQELVDSTLLCVWQLLQVVIHPPLKQSWPTQQRKTDQKSVISIFLKLVFFLVMLRSPQVRQDVLPVITSVH